MLRNPWIRALAIVILAVGLYAYDATTNNNLPKFLQQHCPAPQQDDSGLKLWFKDRCLNLGLDLAGGTQLRYRVDLGQIPDAQKESIVDGIRGVIDKRVNNLGVSEPIVTPSELNGQHYITVELPGTNDIEEAIEKVGKTVLLEFKERKPQNLLTEDEKQADIDFNNEKKAQAEEAKRRAETEDFTTLRQELSETNQYGRGGEFKAQFRDDVLPAYQSVLFDELEVGQASDVLEVKMSVPNEDGTSVEEVVAGYSVVKLDNKEQVEKQNLEPAKASVTHLLVGYQGASGMSETVTRTKEEAQQLASDLYNQVVNDGADFESLIMDNSDDPSKDTNRGSFKDNVIGEDDPTKNAFVQEFNDAIVAANTGDIVGPVETAFGYHIIRIDDKKDRVDELEMQTRVDYQEIFFATRIPSDWRDTGLTGKQFRTAIAQPVTNSLYGYEVSIRFDDEGAQLFKEITARNIDKPVAIFLDGEIISAPTVQSEIANGEAVITGNFSAQEATELAKNLNTGALPAPIKLVDQRQIEATLGAIALQDSVKAGLWGLLFLAVLMIVFYRLPGVLATIALVIYAIILMAMFRLWPGYTLTLAGIAGIILSIGMAVDANILIFERMREELDSGKSLELSVEHGFRRAWSSIRDSNISSLITAMILTVIGTSIVRGFALTLALGIIVSMFSAIWITRGLLMVFMMTPLAGKLSLWTTLNRNEKSFQFMKHRKATYTFSGLMVVATIIILFVFGARLGIDFTGGSLVEVKFNQNLPTTEQVMGVLNKLEGAPVVENQPALEGFVKTEDAAPTDTATEQIYDFSGVQIVSSSTAQTMMLKLPLIDQNMYDRLVAELAVLNNNQPVEKVRFESIGPTIGEGLKQNTGKALIYAIVMMILYIAFAFRKVPSIASPWKFGVTAVVALVHDVLITVGFFGVMGYIAGWEMDTLFVSAMLTVFGFSVHDTIVVFDRIRENLILHGREKSLDDIANDSLNQTMSRSINTSLTTVLVLITLAIAGADSIRPFVFALIFGILIGTYSSIFVATPLLVDWKKKQLQSKRRN